MKRNNFLFYGILSKLEVFSAQERALVNKAYIFASDAHEGQFRQSGEPYIIHPVTVAEYLLSFNVHDVSVICAALLHDVIEDTSVNESTLLHYFGEDITGLVDGVSKIDENLKTFVRRNDKNIHDYNRAKLIHFVQRDIRTLIIKAADRLHNLRTIHALPHEKQLRIARDTLELYIPLIARFGLYKFKFFLEEHVYKILYPIRYKVVKNFISNKVRTGQAGNLKSFTNAITNIFDARNLPYESVRYRVKSPASVLIKKRRLIGKRIRQYPDLFGVRIIVKDVTDCYIALAHVHSIFSPIPSRIKDYIALSKASGYQSLHTTVVNKRNFVAEIQIRTQSMDQVAEYGFAAHWLYKIPSGSSEVLFENINRWITDYSVRESDTDKVNHALRVDTLRLSDESKTGKILVFTPTGNILSLPMGASVLDCAYAFHYDTGSHCRGAWIAGELRPLEYKLRDRDIVDIITGNNIVPTDKWYDYVITESAKSGIKRLLRRSYL